MKKQWHVAIETEDQGAYLAYPDPGNVDGCTPLHYAAAFGFVDMARLLLEAKADPNVRDSQMRTPLHMATQLHGSVEVMKLLVEAGTRVEALDQDGRDAKSYLSPARRRKLGSALMMTTFKLKSHPIRVAMECNHRKLRDYLKVGMPQDKMDELLFYAGCPQVVRLLLNHGADPNVRDRWGSSPLHSVEDPKIARLLLKKGGDPNVVDDQGNTPLHLVTSVEVARELVTAGADLMALNKNGQTPLESSRNVDVAEALIAWGADVNARI